VIAEQRDREGVPHGRPQVEGVELDITEQVLQDGEGMALLALARCGPEDERPALRSEISRVLP
jgi:hypothetical protein